MARERLERTVRLEADIRTKGDQRVEVRGVSTDMYRDAKHVAKNAPLFAFFAIREVAFEVARIIALIVVALLGVLAIFWLVSLVSK